MTQWTTPYPGFEYVPEQVCVDHDRQQAKLEACQLDSSVYGDFVDPSFYITLAIHAGIHSGISAEGNINMLQRLEQHRAVNLGEHLTARGVITAVTDVPRGMAVDSTVNFEDREGEIVISTGRRSLYSDPNKVGTRGAGARPPAVVEDVGALGDRGNHRLAPDRVRAYSTEGNAIHYEMEAAKRAGFRAPMIGGAMGVHFLMAAIWAERAPATLSLDIYFRRPIFWDDAFSVAIDDTSVCSWKWSDEQPKVLTEARINEWN